VTTLKWIEEAYYFSPYGSVLFLFWDRVLHWDIFRIIQYIKSCFINYFFLLFLHSIMKFHCFLLLSKSILLCLLWVLDSPNLFTISLSFFIDFDLLKEIFFFLTSFLGALFKISLIAFMFFSIIAPWSLFWGPFFFGVSFENDGTSEFFVDLFDCFPFRELLFVCFPVSELLFVCFPVSVFSFFIIAAVAYFAFGGFILRGVVFFFYPSSKTKMC